MITLRPITEENFLDAARLRVKQEQYAFVQSAPMILARAYAYRDQQAVCWAICNDANIVGLALIHHLREEPACYHLCEFMIDDTCQGKGYAQEALTLILDHCRREGRFSRIELCVKKENRTAIHVYEKAGFRDSRYQDSSIPDSICMVYDLRAEITYRNIILRDMIESDIEDWIRWETVDTEWTEWDGPDLESAPFVETEFRSECEELLKGPRTGFRNFFELATSDGKHIGMVVSGLTGDNFKYLSRAEIQAGKKSYPTIGIVICESCDWNRGLGTQALTAFCRYLLDHGKSELRLQTWSGNIRMVRCAEKIGFVECNRIVGNRHIRGGTYDGLTFQLDLDRFRKYLEENP